MSLDTLRLYLVELQHPSPHPYVATLQAPIDSRDRVAYFITAQIRYEKAHAKAPGMRQVVEWVHQSAKAPYENLIVYQNTSNPVRANAYIFSNALLHGFEMPCNLQVLPADFVIPVAQAWDRAIYPANEGQMHHALIWCTCKPTILPKDAEGNPIEGTWEPQLETWEFRRSQ